MLRRVVLEATACRRSDLGWKTTALVKDDGRRHLDDAANGRGLWMALEFWVKTRVSETDGVRLREKD